MNTSTTKHVFDTAETCTSIVERILPSSSAFLKPDRDRCIKTTSSYNARIYAFMKSRDAFPRDNSNGLDCICNCWNIAAGQPHRPFLRERKFAMSKHAFCGAFQFAYVSWCVCVCFSVFVQYFWVCVIVFKYSDFIVKYSIGQAFPTFRCAGATLAEMYKHRGPLTNFNYCKIKT